MNFFPKLMTFSLSFSLFFFACGDSSTGSKESNETSGESVETKDDLEKCSVDHSGDVFFVEQENAEYICVAGEWVNVGTSISSESKDIDSSPSKGNSQGTLPTSSSSLFPNSLTSSAFLSSEAESSSSVPDASEVIPIKSISKSFSGVIQKGPFVSGSTVKIWELGEEFELTGTKFEWEVSLSLGAFESPKITLATQYGLLQATGKFYNEVTGSNSTSEMTLKGVVDLSDKDKANLNMLSHLAYNRAMSLYATGDYKNIPAAKAKAEQEVMDAFYMNTKESPLNHAFETLNIFGSSDDDAKLLAISLMLTRGLSVDDIISKLAELSGDIKDDGKWNESSGSLSPVTLADWAFGASSKFSTIRDNLEKMGGTVPNFEKWLNYFVGKVYFTPCTESLDGDMENIDTDGSSYKGKKVVCDGNRWRLVTSLDTTIGYACTKLRTGTIKSYTPKYSLTEYTKICDDGTWRDVGFYDYSKSDFFNETISYGTMTDSRDKKTYKTIKIGTQTWLAENLNYSDSTRMTNLQGNSWCFDDKAKNCDVGGRLYSWTGAMNLASFYLEESATAVIKTNHQGVCPDNWHIPTTKEWKDLLEYVELLGTEGYAGRDLKSQTGWNYESSIKSLDTYGFSAIATGAYYGKYAEKGNTFSAYTFDDEGLFANFWSATESTKSPDTKAQYWFLDYRYNTFEESSDYNQKGRGFPVRCLKN